MTNLSFLRLLFHWLEARRRRRYCHWARCCKDYLVSPQQPPFLSLLESLSGIHYQMRPDSGGKSPPPPQCRSHWVCGRREDSRPPSAHAPGCCTGWWSSSCSADEIQRKTRTTFPAAPDPAVFWSRESRRKEICSGRESVFFEAAAVVVVVVVLDGAGGIYDDVFVEEAGRLRFDSSEVLGPE